MKMLGTMTLCLFVAGCSSQATRERDVVASENAKLQGIWVIVGASLSGGAVPLEALEQNVKSLRWEFRANTFKAYIGGRKEFFEEGTYTIDVGKSPKHLDLVPKKGELLTTRKCVYSVNTDELRIAFSVNVAPGTADEELERAKEARNTRPRTLEPPADSALLLTLKRPKD